MENKPLVLLFHGFCISFFLKICLGYFSVAVTKNYDQSNFYWKASDYVNGLRMLEFMPVEKSYGSRKNLFVAGGGNGGGI